MPLGPILAVTVLPVAFSALLADSFPDPQHLPALTPANRNAPARQVGIDLAVLLEEFVPIVAGRLVGIVRGTEHSPLEVGAGLALQNQTGPVEYAPLTAIIGTFGPHEVVQCPLVCFDAIPHTDSLSGFFPGPHLRSREHLPGRAGHDVRQWVVVGTTERLIVRPGVATVVELDAAAAALVDRFARAGDCHLPPADLESRIMAGGWLFFLIGCYYLLLVIHP